jgi:hypothetical protein
LVAGAALMTWASPRFGYDVEVVDMPARWLSGGLVLAGLAFAVLVPLLVKRSQASGPAQRRLLLLLMLLAGLAARLVLLPSEPMLEDDYQRYLWDGAVAASGRNPYAYSPREASLPGNSTGLAPLARESGPIVGRINHRGLTTIYPPTAQAAFALAHLIAPWSLVAWRLVLLAFDLAVLGLILALLREAERSPLWAVLWWWNPVALKEIANSAHMEPVLLAFLLAALLLAIRRRPLWATAALAGAVGAKLWPALLLPLMLRSWAGERYVLAAALALFAALCALLAAPILLAGLGPESGFLAYAEKWKTNSALFPALERAMAGLLSALGLPAARAGLLVRALIAALLAGLALRLALAPLGDARDLLRRTAILIGALVLLSPAQYPWYALWFAPFLAFYPVPGLLALMATVPLYYLFFHYAPLDMAAFFRGVVVWCIWAPVWALLAWQLLSARRRHAGGG